MTLQILSPSAFSAWLFLKTQVGASSSSRLLRHPLPPLQTLPRPAQALLTCVVVAGELVNHSPPQLGAP